MEFHFQVILYKSERFIEQLLESVLMLEQDHDDKVFLHFREQTPKEFKDQVKNVKSAIDKQKSKNPKVTFTYRSGENLGFGRAHNSLFEENKGLYKDFFILLNHDGMLFFDFLKKIKFYTQALKNESIKWGMLEAIQFPQEHPKVYDAETLETKWCSCACAVVNKDAFENVGAFDDNIFMYGEDVDLSVRMRTEGYKLLTGPTLKFIHITQSFDSKKDPAFEFNHSQAANLYLRLKFGNEKQVNAFMKNLKQHPQFNHQIIEIYEDLKSKLKQSDRKYVKDFLFNHGDYTRFRWQI